MSIQKKYYTNGLLESEVFVVNDLMEGQYKSYYNSKSGNIKPKLYCYYVNGIKHGEEITFDNETDNYSKVQIDQICNYYNGKLNGKLTRYYSNGNLEKEEYYQDNYREGECKYYNENGTLDEVINYNNDCMDGDYYKYYEGLLETKCEYYRDEYMGSMLVGDYINYYPNGQIKNICTYEDGKKNGEYMEYHETHDNSIGKLKAKGNYENGYRVGYEYRCDIDGNLIGKEFVDDNMDEDEYNENNNTV